ncbi:MAG: dTDP-glucose 4,6-dehydratase [Epulopiscium sp. Nuni2H_MBin003]|nr:MAG: dTDP-glucose 4,6-dehydratase [Epulopiscium sp. Nuni2H_MBin003]
MKNILVTGGLGFIGSNFIRYMLDKYHYQIINLDLQTYAGRPENLSDVEDNPNYTFVKGDIRDKTLVEEVFSTYNINTVINFAAQSHVDKSIIDPQIFLSTNVIGTHTLLEVAKAYHQAGLEIKFIQISTDEVYGTLGATGMFTEDTPLAPNSPYSASKASADFFVRAYHETFGLPVNITRCSNNYGPYQFPEKLIPLMINNCINNKKMPIYGDGLQIRDWLHVKDHCIAIDKVLHKGMDGAVYNIGGNNEKANIDIVKLIIDTLGKGEDLIEYVTDRLGHDRRYAIDNTKITTELGFCPGYTFEEGIKETIEWYLKKSH